MQISTKLLNQQQVRHFSKIHERIADVQEKSQAERIFCEHLMTLSLLPIYPWQKNRAFFCSNFKEI